MPAPIKVEVETVSPLFLLFVVFLVLKLTHVIAWSWWWVTAPLWGGVAVGIGALFIIALVALGLAAATLFSEWLSGRRRG